jgi:hypothetical protein
MKYIVIAGAVTMGIILLLSVGLAGYFYFVIFGNNDQTLARNFDVTNEWKEIRIDPPVKPEYRHQALDLRPVGFTVDRTGKDSEIRLPDGTVVEPVVEIYDEHGNMFPLHKGGFTMGRNDYVDFTPGTGILPSNGSYVYLRIRSDIPFVCDEILWIDYDPK